MAKRVIGLDCEVADPLLKTSGWSWKYEAQDSVTRTLTKGSTATASFTNVPKIIKWLTDEFYIDNRFGIWR